MKTQEYTIVIDASREKVWDILLGEDSYPEWTAPFAEGSSVETDWKKGSRAVFGDGSGSGMVAEIAENIPAEYLSIRHLGTIKDGVEDLDSEQTKQWAGALENYTLKSVDGKTELIIHLDTLPAYEDYMNKTWPLALAKVKELSEN